MGNMNARREYEHGTHIPRAGDIVVNGRVQAEWVARGWAWVEEAWHRVHIDQEQANSDGSSGDAANDAAGLGTVGGDSSGIETPIETDAVNVDGEDEVVVEPVTVTGAVVVVVVYLC